MSIIGYKRVSSESQSIDRQDLGEVDKVFEEKLSGKSASDRPALMAVIDYAREGDTVKVHSIDRLARDLCDLQSIISQLNDKGVTISFLSESLTFSADADDAFAKLQLQMMGAFAEFARNIIRKRQAEGIAKAKERGVYKNRKRKTVIDRDAVQEVEVRRAVHVKDSSPDGHLTNVNRPYTQISCLMHKAVTPLAQTMDLTGGVTISLTAHWLHCIGNILNAISPIPLHLIFIHHWFAECCKVCNVCKKYQRFVALFCYSPICMCRTDRSHSAFKSSYHIVPNAFESCTHTKIHFLLQFVVDFLKVNSAT